MLPYKNYKAPPNRDASTKARGLMAPADKSKLDGILAGASRLVTTALDGLMSAVDKVKLDNLYTPGNASGSVLVTNFNTITKSGFYNGSLATGAPGGAAWYFVIHVEHSGMNGYSHQLAFAFAGPDNIVWQRDQTAGSWNPWYKLVYNGDSGWIDVGSYAANYSAYDGTLATFRPQYRKLPSGVVIFRGLIKKSVNIATNENMFNMPAGYRNGDTNGSLFPMTNAAGYMEARVYPSGQVNSGSIIGAGGGNAYISLASLSYLAEA